MFWVFFHLFILLMLWLDYRLKGGMVWRVLLWVLLALGFTGVVLGMHGGDAAVTFFTAYVVEASLSLDNLFVFFMIFSALNIAKVYQHKILLFGILGAFCFRIACIVLGISLLQAFSWLYPILGAILCVSAWCAWKAQKTDIQDTLLFRGVKKLLPFEASDHRGRFFVKKGKKWQATSLFCALVLIELFDLIFAVDSVPAVLAITQDLFLAYTSNVFAVLGLRSFYLALVQWQEKVAGLQSAISCILLFIGAKMLLSPWLHISNGISLAVIGGIILLTFLKNRYLR